MSEETLFHRALERPAGERAAFLDQACAGDAALRRRVEALLRAHDQPGSFLAKPALDPAATGEPRPDHAEGEAGPGQASGEGPGSRVGPYKLLQQIGAGGMGAVFMAEQTHPVQRKVALKVIKPGMDTAQVVARFEAERQALALMDHPHIARVLDAGTTESGRPYFVMELVKGVPLTRYCDERRLTPRERLALFIPVCQAVQHAHQKGIIHRDLKPANVLVALYDGKPVPKVIDFGVAKATGQPLTERTLFTGFGAVVGTLEYMSPEQAELNQLDIDTRSDIYTLGVLLYELLTGTTPLDRKRVKEAGLLEALRLIREEETQRPSTRLSTAEELPRIAAERGLEPRKLSGLLRGELDWIVMKCLEKERDRRYETASALARDVERYLRDEPVQACPPSAAYRFRKFARRHKRALVTLALLGLTLLAGLALAAAVLAVSYGLIQQALRKQQTETEKKENALTALGAEERRTKRTLYLNQIALADREWEANNLDRAEQVLDECPADLRGWEWHYLKGRCQKQLLTLRGRQMYEYQVALSPDGKRLATASLIQGGKVWDATTGRELVSFGKPGAFIYPLAFSPDGRRLVGVMGGKDVMVWEAGTGRELLRLHRPNTLAYFVAQSPKGRRLATAEWGAVKVWDATTGRLLVTCRGPRHAITSVSFSPDGRQLASADNRRMMRWDATTGRELPNRGVHFTLKVVFSPAARRLATVNRHGFIRISEPDAGWEVLTLGEYVPESFARNYARCLSYSPDGKQLAAVVKRGVVKVWDAINGKELVTIRGHVGEVTSVAFDGTGQCLATAGTDGTVKVWNVALGHGPLTIPGERGFPDALGFSPDGKALARAVPNFNLQGKLEVWDTASGRRTLSRPLVPWQGTHLVFPAEGKPLLLAGCSLDRTAGVVWDARSGRQVLACRSPGKTVARVFLSPDGKRMTLHFIGGTVKVWDTTTGKELYSPRGVPGVISAAFSADGR
jgi:serine/threonine protein kinase/WD40 repeat protein